MDSPAIPPTPPAPKKTSVAVGTEGSGWGLSRKLLPLCATVAVAAYTAIGVYNGTYLNFRYYMAEYENARDWAIKDNNLRNSGSAALGEALRNGKIHGEFASVPVTYGTDRRTHQIVWVRGAEDDLMKNFSDNPYLAVSQQGEPEARVMTPNEFAWDQATKACIGNHHPIGYPALRARYYLAGAGAAGLAAGAAVGGALWGGLNLLSRLGRNRRELQRQEADAKLRGVQLR